MTTHDVSDGFDPSFFDTILVIRQPEQLGVRGRNQASPAAPIATEAVVEALSGATTRDGDYQVGEKVLRVTTFFRLRGPTPSGAPDTIVVDGAPLGTMPPLAERYAAHPDQFDHYQVSDLSDFSRYGAGFTTATVTLTDLVPQPPTEG